MLLKQSLHEAISAVAVLNLTWNLTEAALPLGQNIVTFWEELLHRVVEMALLIHKQLVGTVVLRLSIMDII